MPRPKPNKLHDELDALLDGRPVELTDELAPLVEAADALRAELAALQLDPAVADRHLERIMQGSATVVQLPPRRQANGWDLRRRVAAVALAAALVLAPATMASAAALPGQAIYPFKLAIEQLRIASVQWSPSREAGERTRVADERLGEVQDLIELKMFTQLPNALTALGKAVTAAQVAVQEAAQEGEPVSAAAARLSQVQAVGGQVVQRVAIVAATGSVNLPDGTREAIQAAVEQTQVVLPAPDRPLRQPNPTPTPTTSAGPSDPGPDPTSAPPPPPPAPEPPTTEAPPPTTSTPPPTTDPPTTDPPPTTESTATPGSAGGGDSGVAERTPAADDVPPPTLEVPAP
jgi:Domain of unknown function (DUF5667)